MYATTPHTPKSVSSASSDSTDLEDDPDVAVVEMLLEPYFMQVRGPAGPAAIVRGWVAG